MSFFFSSRRRHTRFDCDWSSDVCSSDLLVEQSMKAPSPFYVSNVARGIFLLDAMLRHRIRNFIFASTCAVYGEPHVIPIPEDHPKSPINPYGKSKLAFEDKVADA